MIRYIRDSLLLTAFTIALVTVLIASVAFGIADLASRHRTDGSASHVERTTEDVRGNES